MIPLTVTVVLALVSFIASQWVLFSILLPILPPHPLSRRVPPSVFGLPTFGSLSPADKSNLCFAFIDLLALGAFIWQVVVQQNASGSFNVTYDPAGAARLWFATTARQTCICIVLLIAIVHVRQGRTVSLGPFLSFLIVPAVLVVALATTLAAICAAVGMPSLFTGIAVYSGVIALVSLVTFLTIVRTIVNIRRHLAALEADPWPPVKEKRRGSFATEDVEALKEGSSWITSHRSSHSHHNSVSSFAFSVRSALPSSHNSSARDRAKLVGSTTTLPPAKNSYWFGMPSTTDLNIPPVPALPGHQTHEPSPDSPVPSIEDDNHDPFRRDEPRFPRIPKSSSNSWLTEPSVSQPTMTEWSFPPTRPSSPSPVNAPTSSANLLPASATTVAFASPLPHGRVLGGYNYIPELDNRIKGLSSGTLSSKSDAPTSIWRAVGWVSVITAPFLLAIPYLVVAAVSPTNVPDALSILFILSMTMSSPLLALNVVLRSPMPMPATLFPPRDRTKSSLLPSLRSASVGPYGGSTRANTPTVIEGRRSGDIWLDRGDAMDGQSRIERVFAMATRVPKLSVLPSECTEAPQLTPPLPMQTQDYNDMTISDGSGIPVDEPSHTARNGKPYHSIGKQIHNQSKKASSYYSGAPSTKFESKIYVAERHLSAMALTMVLPPSAPQSADGDHQVMKRSSVAHSRSQSASSNVVRRTSAAAHSRSQSASSTVNRFPSSPTPPPDSPLPPTPESLKAPGIRHVRAKSSTSVYSFSPIVATTQIDGLSAGMLPLLVPGLKVQKDIVKDDWDARHIAADVQSQREVLSQARVQGPPANVQGPTANVQDRPATVRSHHTVARSVGQSQSLSQASKFGSGKMSTGSAVYPHSLSMSFSSPEHHSTPPVVTRRTSRSRSYHYSLPSLGLGKGANFISEIAAALTTNTQSLRNAKEDTRRRTMHGMEYTQLLAPSNRASRASSREPSRERPARPRSYQMARGPSPSPEVARNIEAETGDRVSRRTHRRSLSAGSNAARRAKSKSKSPMRQPIPPPTVSTEVDDPFVTPSITPTSGIFPDSTRDDASIHSTRRVPVKQATAERPRAFHLPTTSSRPPSSIIYIKSQDEPQSAASRTSFAIEEEPAEPVMSPVSPWEGILSAAGALVARTGSSPPDDAKKAPKPLRLLQERDPNAPTSPILSSAKTSTRPLVVKKRSAGSGKQDENSNTTGSTPSIKTLRLVRTATAKARAKWRQNEVLPTVVVRAPSNASTAHGTIHV